MEFHGKFSMELHGILSGFGTWNSMENIPWNSMEDFPWNSMEFCLGLGHGIPWKSMELFFSFMEFPGGFSSHGIS